MNLQAGVLMTRTKSNGRVGHAAESELIITDAEPSRDWEELYAWQEAETMPWFSPTLDPDVARALERYEILRGRALDIGSGPGTQAVELARLGFEVTAVDVSESAVREGGMGGATARVT